MERLIYILYTSNYVTLGTPVCLQIHFSNSCVFPPKHVNVLCIYGLFAAAGERQGSDTLEAVKSCFHLQIKSVFVFFPFLTLVVFPVWPLGGETPQTQELRKSEQNTIFIPYIQYIQCNTTRLSAQGSAHLSTSLSTPESHQSAQTGWIQKERKKSLLSSSSCVATGTKVKQNGFFCTQKCVKIQMLQQAR